jgi:hypothetical protein
MAIREPASPLRRELALYSGAFVNRPSCFSDSEAGRRTMT